MKGFLKICSFMAGFFYCLDTEGQTYIQFQSSRGTMVAVPEDLRAIQGWPNIYKLDYAVVLKGKEYHRHLNNPLWGLSFTYIDHDHEATGKSYSLSSFLQPSIVRKKKHDISGRVSVGFSYVENPFDEIYNPFQLAIGSRFNFIAEGQLIYSYNFFNNWSFNLLTGITHISNAARRLPNAGFNIVSSGFGLSYRMGEESKVLLPNFNSPGLDYNRGAFSHYVHLRGGLKSMRSLDYEVFPAVGLNYTSAYRYHPLGSITMGLDVDYNEGYIQERKAINERVVGHIPFNSWRWAIAAGHELHMNRLSLVTQYAFYLQRPHPDHRIAYQRYGLKYHLTKKTIIAATLRAHAGRADYMEWTIGRKL